jgi:hypothetical protein
MSHQQQDRMLDPISHAWAHCNPRVPLPESLRDSWRGAPLKEAS